MKTVDRSLSARESSIVARGSSPPRRGAALENQLKWLETTVANKSKAALVA